MKEYLKSPIFWVAAIVGVRWLYTNKPDSKLTNMFREVEEGAENAAYQTTNYARSMVNEGVDTIEDGLGALGWGMGDGDDIASQDLDPGRNAVGGGTNVERSDASDMPSDSVGGGVGSNGGYTDFAQTVGMPGDVDLIGGLELTGRKNPMAGNSKANHLDFSSSNTGDVDYIGISKRGSSHTIEWDDDAEGSGNANTGSTGINAFSSESGADNASERANFKGSSKKMSFNDFDY